jgi:hypothetical protein
MPDALKPFDQILEADSIWQAFVLRNRETREARKITLRDYYSAVERITLSSAVPESIREHFDVARNLLLYSWFEHRFMPVAEMHAFSSVEYALRLKSGKPKLMLKQGIELAIKENWIKDNGFRHYRVRQEEFDGNEPATKNQDVNDVHTYCKVLLNSIPDYRNTLAHGNTVFHPFGHRMVTKCADLINQLFEPS